MNAGDNLPNALSRRDFIRLVGLTGGVALAPGLARSALAAEVTADQIIKGKVPDMIIHNATLGVMETPLPLLREHALTPKPILYNRTHFPVSGDNAWVATTAAPDATGWTIDVSGLVTRPRTLTLDTLRGMEQSKVTAVMQCAGNGRAYYAAKQKAPGGQWHHGGMGNLAWEGPKLRAVLDKLDLGPGPDARWLSANGRDVPPTFEGADFIKSFRLDDPALDHAILALTMNDEPIPAIHGGPVRLIIPGYYGNMNVKFVSQLLLAAEQSPTPFQSKAYRMPDKIVQPGEMTPADYTTSNSRPTYAFKIMSVIFSPLTTDTTKSGPVTISGVAWNDGTAPITSVRVSTNGGTTWLDAAIEEPTGPFAWHHWKADTTLDKGAHQLMVIATDAAGHTQPMDGNAVWNPKGYEWSGVDRVDLTLA